MYLKSLEINGFKSFPQKTVLTFMPKKEDRQSITAIVGPNGSGKSNVSDAIRWVLGEQSMKMLRAKKSGDLIFGGSESKGKMSAASVAMTIDNSDGRLPIDYDELVITRRIYRTGEGEYLINGNPVRLLDLQILLAKAQFGQGSYSVIGQGMIDRLLLQTPVERKDFFDEAFGIKEFQIKRHQAVLKLSRTKDHIDQAEAILAEVAPRLRSLSRQVKKLEERQEVEVRLREVQESYYTALWQNNENQLGELQKDLLDIEKKYKDSHKKLTFIQEELSGLAKESSREDAYNKLQADYQELLNKKNNLEKEKAEIAGRMQVEYSKAGKHNVGWLENKISSLKQEQNKLQHQTDEAHRIIGSLREEEKKQKSELEKLTIERAELRGRLSTLETQFIQAKSEQNFIQSTGLKAVQAILENKNKFGKIYGTLAQLAEVKDKYQLAMDVAAGSHLSSIVVEEDVVAEECIRYLRREHLGVATFLPLNKIRPRIISQDIQNFIDMPGVHGLAVDLAKFSNRFSNIFSYIFGSTLVVEDIETARTIGIGKVRMVTLDGDVMETSGSMKGGYHRQRHTGLSFANGITPDMAKGDMMDRGEKIAEVKEELDNLEIKYEKIQQAVLSAKTEFEIENKKQDFLRDQKQELDRELASLEQELSLNTMSKEEYGTALDKISIKKDEIDKLIAQLEKDISIYQNKIEQFHAQEEEKKQRIFSLQDSMQAEQSVLNKITMEKNEKQIAIAKLDTKQEDLSNEVYQELRTSIESIIRKEGEKIELGDIESAQTQIQKLKYKLTLVGGIDDEVVGEYKETRERHDSLASQLDDLTKAMDDLEKLVTELDDMMKKRRAKSFKNIQKEFKRYFSILFEGGKADLQEIYSTEDRNDKISEGNFVGDEETRDMRYEIKDKEIVEEDLEIKKTKRKGGKNILTGIDITACPPGKKIKDIQALSGGERTLTSIALICAILNVNPPPFSVLDEVEAALDEANTQRFAQILQELSKQSQFILITHNRATMHSADALYGVTMGGGGVSHLLSVKLDEAQRSVQEPRKTTSLSRGKNLKV